jgi:bifunctional enzyme CysN/CysC
MVKTKTKTLLTKSRVNKRKSIDKFASNDVRSLPKNIEDFLVQENKKDLLRFITCGSVDDGKSTLIGRLLYDCQSLLEDQLQALELDSKNFGTQGETLDFSLLVDGLAAEREQGITIDVAYRFFSTNKRKFIVADTPGHEQYTRNMITGASTADLAVILVDATQGLLTQTKRHAYLVSLMGIKQVILAINKIDLVGYSQDIFNKIRLDFKSHVSNFGFDDVTAIPVSALLGDNITELSKKMRWYQGSTVLHALECANILSRQSGDKNGSWSLPVQWVNRPNAQFRGFSGTIASGQVKVGDQIRVTASGEIASIIEIITPSNILTKTGESASQGEAVTISLAQEIDISRGDVLTLANAPLLSSDQFESVIIWLAPSPGLSGRSYELLLSTQQVSASITVIKHRIDINTMEKNACTQLALNEIAVCNIALNKPIAYEEYSLSKELGGFILVDRFSNATVAAGLIRHNLRRADNIHTQAFTVSKIDREKLSSQKGKVIWFTGLSGSGKSTLANALEVELHKQGKHTYILDGDNVRQGLNKDLGFTDADRVENIRRIAEVAKLMMDAGLIVITAFISPFESERKMAKELIGLENFMEVFVDTPITICENRDPKGLYKKARVGRLPNFSGVSSPYESPTNPDITINACNIKNIEYSITKILQALNYS